jgi:hypothetical protein
VRSAAARALHREEPPPWVLDDHLALGLAGDEGVSITRSMRDELSAENLVTFSRWMCVRARLAEDVVERAVAAGIRQYAILGAGLDSFAYRRPDLLGRLRVFEVDHPASQAWKRERLAELGVDLPANLVFAAVDFETQTLSDGLVAALVGRPGELSVPVEMGVVRRQEVFEEDLADELAPAADAGLGEHRLQVVLHRVWGEVEAARDLARREALADESCERALAGGQAVGGHDQRRDLEGAGLLDDHGDRPFTCRAEPGRVHEREAAGSRARPQARHGRLRPVERAEFRRNRVDLDRQRRAARGAAELLQPAAGRLVRR